MTSKSSSRIGSQAGFRDPSLVSPQLQGALSQILWFHTRSHVQGRKREKYKSCQVPVAHACNPSYSGGRDQDDCDSKPAWANSL
jgi:hypothetical protein